MTVLDRGAVLGATVTFTVDGLSAPRCSDRLARRADQRRRRWTRPRRGSTTTAAASTRRVRSSVHYYNDDNEIDLLVDAVRRARTSRARPEAPERRPHARDVHGCARPASIVTRVSAMDDPDRSTIWPYDEDGEPRDFYYPRYAHPAGRRGRGASSAARGRRRAALRVRHGRDHACVLALRAARHDLALAEGCYYGTASCSASSRAGASRTSSTTRPAPRPTPTSSGSRRRPTRC